MTDETYPANLQTIIDQASALTEEQARSLADHWENDEEVEPPSERLGWASQGEIDYLSVSNAILNKAWLNALEAAGEAGRALELDAARAAGRAVKDAVHHFAISDTSKNAAEAAARAAVLAVAVRDLITETDFNDLVEPWQKAVAAV